MAECKHCERRRLLDRPPCKDHRIGETMEGKSNSRNNGLISSYERQRVYKGITITYDQPKIYPEMR